MVERLIPDDVPSSMLSPPESSLSDPEMRLAAEAIQEDTGTSGYSGGCVAGCVVNDSRISEIRGFCVKGALSTENSDSTGDGI